VHGFELKELQEDEDRLGWQEALARDPEYYMNTKEGQEELAQMIRRESERLLEEIGKSVKPTKEIIWLSRYCTTCKFFSKQGSKTTCNRWNVRIVKPFYGRPIWESIPKVGSEMEKERIVSNIDWSKKWKEISDKIVEWAIDKVNAGFPYFCYTRKSD
jgi:hypothetical protein